MGKSKIFIILIFINITSEKLLSVYTIARHAARSSINYTKDLVGSLFGGNSKLTINGMIQAQQLGRAFKKRYIEKYKLLNEIYDEKQVKFQTGLSQRTIFSLYGLINGLYPNYSIDLSSEIIDKIPENNFDIPFYNEDKFISENKINLEILTHGIEKAYEPKKCNKINLYNFYSFRRTKA